MTKRTKKRTIIICIYLALFLTCSFLVYRAVAPAPTCTDGKQNQREAGVDCGGPCRACDAPITAQDLVVNSTHILYGGAGIYDVVAEIQNPNTSYGASRVAYTMTLTDAAGAVVGTERGTTFILPAENKYVIGINIGASQTAAAAVFTIDSVEWVRFVDFVDPTITIFNQRVGLAESGSTNYAEAFGTMRNDSAFDFRAVTINILVEDARGVPIAVNRRIEKTVDANEERAFRVSWPQEFPGTISGVRMFAEANVFDSQNFVQKFLEGGAAQKLQ